jgi:hypothetical protein
MMIKPPGQFFRWCILEIDDGVLVAIKQIHVKEVSGPVQQTAVINFRFRVDAFFVKARESGGRGHAIETVTVIEQAKLHGYLAWGK